MRISTGYQFDTYSRGVSAAQERVFEAQTRVQTGKRLNRPSDDPLGTQQVLSMRSLRRGLEQYSGNLTTAKGWLGFTETALGDAHDLLKRGYEIAVRGANAPTDQTGRRALAEEVRTLQSRLLDLGNARGPSGAHLFAGQRTDAPPFTAAAGALTYNGDANAVRIETGPVETLAVNSPGAPLFSDAYARLESLRVHLENGDAGAVADVDIAALQTSLGAFALERGAVGAKLRQVDDQSARHLRRSDDLTARIADVEEVDLSQAIMDYRSAETAYQAALNVASQGFRLSLMDFIRG